MRFPQVSSNFAPIRLFIPIVMLAIALPAAHAVPTQLTFTPTNLRFGEVAVGQVETMFATIANAGSSSITVSNVQMDAPQFTVTPPAMPFTLAPGQSINVKVAFQPTAAGPATGSLAFDGGQSYLYLHGWGLSRGALISNPPSPEFSNVPVGTSAKLQALLTNSSNAAITLSQDLVAGSGFGISGVNFPLTLQPGQTQPFSVTFTPQSAGISSGNVKFASAGTTVLIVPLTGVGASAGSAGQLSIAPGSLSFGKTEVGSTATQTGTLNATSGSVTISSASSSNAQFSLNGLSLPVTIPAGQSASFSVTFAPKSSGATSANLTFASNAGNTPGPLNMTGSGGKTQSENAHGMFILDPPSNDNNCAGMPSMCFSQHLIPTLICTGSGTPAGYNCKEKGAGEPYIKGAIFYIRWDMVSAANGIYDFTMPDNRMAPWIAAGKMVSFDFIPTSQESSNNVTPSWYLKPVKIASVSQTGGIVEIQTSAAMGFFPGGVTAAPGLEVQITGTGTALDGNGTAANPGIWTVCNHTTPGCQDPTSQTIYAIGSGSDIAPVKSGTVGNPVYGTASGLCGSGILPIEWRPNFMKAWQQFMQQAVAHYANNSSVSYLRFGLGIGGENIPNHGTNNASCQAQMTKYGFTSVTAPWPKPGSTQWPEISGNWIAYVKGMLQYENSLNSPKVIATTISPIEPVGDFVTPDATAANAVAVGLGFGNQGLQKSDPTNYASGLPCLGGNWCANLQKYKGQVPVELQTLDYSDPTDTNQAGSLVPLLPFATSLGAQILELYVDDWLCTYDTYWNGNNKYGECNAAGYPSVFSAVAAQIN